MILTKMKKAGAILLSSVLICSAVLQFNETVAYAADSSFEAQLTAQGFPESYKVELRKLHEAHPNWTFKAKLLDYTWDEAVKSPTDPCIRSQLTVLFNFLFIECYRVFSNPLKIAEASEPSTREQINMIKNYLRDNSGRDSSIDVLAHIAGYSRSHFLRLFRKYANCHVKEYINMIREEKYSRIKDTHPVKSIAWELGFSSTAAFNHWQKGKRKSSPLHRNSAERET